MILRMPGARNCNNPLAADIGSCQCRISAARATSREATPECSLPLVPRKGVTDSPCSLAEDENTRLTGKADFLHLPIFAEEHGVILRLGATVFPATLGFRNNLLAFLDGGLVSFDLQTVFTGR